MDGKATPVVFSSRRRHTRCLSDWSSDVCSSDLVDFDVTPLSNGVPFNATQAGNPLPRYFSYDVSSNASAVAFQLLGLNGNLDLVARTTPFPTLASFDYGSFNPGTNDEDIIVFANSTS